MKFKLKKFCKGILFSFALLACGVLISHTTAAQSIYANSNAGTTVFSDIGNYKVLTFSAAQNSNSVKITLPSGVKVVKAFMAYENEIAAELNPTKPLEAGQAMQVQAPSGKNYDYPNATNLLTGNFVSDENSASANQFADITNSVLENGAGTYTNVSPNVGGRWAGNFMYVIVQSSSYPLEDVVLTNFSANDSSETGLVTSAIPITLTAPFLPNVGAKGAITTFVGSLDPVDELTLSYNGGENLVQNVNKIAQNSFVTADYTISNRNNFLNFNLALQNNFTPPTKGAENISTMLVQVPVSPCFVTYSMIDQNGNPISQASGLSLGNQLWRNPDGSILPENLDASGKIVLNGLAGTAFPNFKAPLLKGFAFVKEDTNNPNFLFNDKTPSNVSYHYTNLGTVTEHFVDAQGKSIASDIKFTGEDGLPAPMKAVAIGNYYLDTTHLPAALNYIAGKNQEVTYHYIKAATLKIIYQDAETNGTRILKEQNLRGPLGSSYDNSVASQKILSDLESQGYQLLSTAVQKGTFGSEIQTLSVKMRLDESKLTIPQATWKVDENNYKVGYNVSAELIQPVNDLTAFPNYRYSTWETILSLPSDLKRPSIVLQDDKGNNLPCTKTALANGQIKLTVSAETMKTLPFKGESYHFVIKGQINPELTDGSRLTFEAKTSIAGQTRTAAYTTKEIAHKALVTVKYLRQDSTDAVLKSRNLTFGYGKAWKILPATAPEGYYFDKEDTKTALSGNQVNFEKKSFILYYAPVEKNVHVNYLDESGQKIADATDFKANYLDAYTTSAQDLDDEYSLVTSEIPKNAAGIVGNKDITVNYIYRQTKGQWMNLGYGSRGMTRLDYHGHIRSNSLNYADGQILTLINTNEGIELYQDSVDEGAISDQTLKSGESQKIMISPSDSISIQVLGMGKAILTRSTPTYTMTTVIQKGNFTNTTKVYHGKDLIERDLYQANGVKGLLLKGETDQVIEGKYQIVAKQVLQAKADLSLNQTTVDAAGTDYETLLNGAESDNQMPEKTPFSKADSVKSVPESSVASAPFSPSSLDFLLGIPVSADALNTTDSGTSTQDSSGSTTVPTPSTPTNSKSSENHNHPSNGWFVPRV